MITKNKLKYLKSLKMKKHRIKQNQILIEGVKLINESINANAYFESIYCSEKFYLEGISKSFLLKR